MKKMIKFFIFLFYTIIVVLRKYFMKQTAHSWLENKDKKWINPKIGLFSISGIENEYTAGDESILEFYSIACNLNQQTKKRKFRLLDVLHEKARRNNMKCVRILIVRDLLSFVVADLLRIFRFLDNKIIYYSTDVFWKRVPLDGNKIIRLIYTKCLFLLEKNIWSRADHIFTNRTDELDTIRLSNQFVSLVPAKSRITKSNQIKLPSRDSELIFLFVGAAGNIPNRQSVSDFLYSIWPSILKVFPQSKLRIIGRDWNNHINPSKGVILTGFLSAAELEAEYKEAHFAVGYLSYGAGVKGKVLEAMENNTVVLGNDIGFAGIECDSLVPFINCEDLMEQITGYLDPAKYCATVKDYESFLLQNYCYTLIEKRLKKTLNRML